MNQRTMNRWQRLGSMAADQLRVLKLKLMPEMRKRPRIKKAKSERRRFKPFSRSMVRRRRPLLLSWVSKRNQVTDLMILLRSSSVFLQSSAFCHFRKLKTTSFNDSQNKKKLTGWPGSRVDPPGRPGFPGPIPERVFAFTRNGPRLGSAGSQVNPPGRFGF